MNDTLPASTIEFIERGLSDGKPVERSMLEAYARQTGRTIPTAASSPVAPAVKAPPRSARSRPPARLPECSPCGFLKLQRSEVAMELLGDKNALHLLTVIAYRARWSDGANLDGLTFGQAFVGDHDKINMTRKEYRCAASRLEGWGLATFHGTPRGTVATLKDSRVFSLNDERDLAKQGHDQGQLFSEENDTNGASPRANEGPAKGQRGATNEEGKKERRKESQPSPAAPPRARDQLFDALASAAGCKPSEVTGRAAAKCGVALAEIRKASPDVTPDEIHRRARNYRTHFRDAALTPHALAMNWAKCSGSGAEPTRLGVNVLAQEYNFTDPNWRPSD